MNDKFEQYGQINVILRDFHWYRKRY